MKPGKLQLTGALGFIFSLLNPVITTEVEAELCTYFLLKNKLNVKYIEKSVAIHQIPILYLHLRLFKPWTRVVNFALTHWIMRTAH